MKARLCWLFWISFLPGFSTAVGAFKGEVVINEIAWSGTAADAAGEWIELYNTTSAPVDLTGWTLAATSGGPRIALRGTIAPCGYFLLERDGGAFGELEADQLYSGTLDDGGDALLLRDENGDIVDSANGDSGRWPGGSADVASMERINPFAADSDGNWGTNDGTATHGVDDDGRPLKATPGHRNAAFDAPPVVARLVAEPSVAVPGGTITYRVIIANTTDRDIADLSYRGPIDANTTLEPASIKTTPLALSGSVQVEPDTPLPLTLMGLDPDGDALRFAIVEGPRHGTLGSLTQQPPNSALVTYTPNAGFRGFDRLRFAVEDGSGGACEAILDLSIGAAPAATADQYAASGNIAIAVGADQGVIANDGGNQLAVVQVQGAASGIGVPTETSASGLNGAPGLVTLEADGSFTYVPPPGFVGDDTFTYAVDNSFAAPSTATVTLSVEAMVWFIEIDASGDNNGTLAHPFRNIADFNAAQGDDAPNAKPGDLIFLFTGTYASGIVLQNDQTLLGQGADIAAFFSAAPHSTAPYPPVQGARPVLATSGGNAIELAQNNAVRGLDISDTPASFGVASGSANSGALVIRDVAITGAGGAIRLATDGELDIEFDRIAASGSPGAGIRIEGGTGTFAVSGFTAINAALSTGIEIVDSNARFRFAAVDIDNRQASGISIANADGPGIDLGPTTISNFEFAPGYGLRVEASAAPVAIASVQIQGTVRSADESANQAARQIPLNDGDGDGIFLKNNSGPFTLGGPSAITASGDNGIDMRGVVQVSLDQVVIDGSQDSGLQGIGVESFSFTNGRIANFGDDISSASPPVNDSGMWFRDLTGTVVISGSTIGPDANFASTPFPPAIANDGIEIWNGDTGALDLALTGVELTNISNDGIDIRTQSGGVALRVDGRIGPSTFTQLNGRALNLEHAADLADNGPLDLQVHSGIFADIGIGVRLQVAGGGTGKAQMDGNTMTAVAADGVRLLADSGNIGFTAGMDARIGRNAFGGGGALIAARRGAQMRLAFHNNSDIGGQGIVAESSRQANLEATFDENQIVVNTAAPGFALAAFFAQVANPTLGAASACIDLDGNVLEALGGAADPIAFDQSGTSSLFLAGWGGGDNASAAAFVAGRNSLIGGISFLAGNASAGPTTCTGPSF